MGSGWTTARRVKAARALAGYRNTGALAADLGPGLSDKTLRKIESERDPRQAKPHELEMIARACGLTPAFFSVDFAQLEPDAPPFTERLGEIAEALAPDVPQEQLAGMLYDVLNEVTEDFAQVAAGVLAERLKEAGLNPGNRETSPPEGDTPRGELRFDPDRPRGAQAPPEDHRHAS